MSKVILYHSGCWDGFCAAWLFWKALPDAEFIPVNYGQPIPNIEGKEVYILDFCYKRSELEVILSKCLSCVILDHHKTAQVEIEGLTHPKLKVTFDMSHSGARLAWDYLIQNKILHYDYANYYGDRRPWIVDYCEDRDLWKWGLPKSKEINAWVRSFPLDFKGWDRFHTVEHDPSKIEAIVTAGEAILRTQEQVVQSHVHFAYEVEIAGTKGLAANATSLSSEIAGELAKKASFGAVWFAKEDGTMVWSLRSVEGGADVSALAKQLGGGGHKHAAGFMVRRLIDESFFPCPCCQKTVTREQFRQHGFGLCVDHGPRG